MSGGSQVPQAYQPTGQQSADIGYQNILESMTPYASAVPSYVVPQLQKYTQAQLQNPFAAQAIGGAQQAGQTATGTVAPMQLGGAQTLYGMGQQYSPYGAQALAQGFDPQNALYDRNYQRLMDQQNAINAQAGIAGTPYGAGVAGQTAANFNLDWTQQALNREATAAATAGGLAGETSNLFGAAGTQGQGGLQTLNYGSMLPYSIYGAVNQNYMNALNAYSGGVGQAFAPGAGVAGLQGNYLGIGQQATSLNQQAAQIQAQQDAAMWGGLGSILGMSNNSFGGSLLSSGLGFL